MWNLLLSELLWIDDILHKIQVVSTSIRGQLTEEARGRPVCPAGIPTLPAINTAAALSTALAAQDIPPFLWLLRPGSSKVLRGVTQVAEAEQLTACPVGRDRDPTKRFEKRCAYIR